MGGQTEPIIAVIGFPIGGNPSQFALERGLESVGLEWRVFSFDVTPMNLHIALDGLEVLGVRGVLLGTTLLNAARPWRATSDGDGPDYTDCLYRDDPQLPLLKFDAQHSWIKSKVNEHAAYLNRDIQRTIVFGAIPKQAVWQTNLLKGTMETAPRDLDGIADADVVVIQDGRDGPLPLDLALWPSGGQQTLVIDVSEGHPHLLEIQSMGYNVISRSQRRVAMLCECFRRWTAMEAPRDVIVDAIEEYLAV